MAYENVMIAIGGLGLTDPQTIREIVGDLQEDYGNVEFFAQAYCGDRQNTKIEETHFNKFGIGIYREFPKSYFDKAACGTAPVLIHAVFARVVQGATGDGKTPFKSLVVIASQKEALWFTERREFFTLAEKVGKMETPVVILVARQPGQRDDDFSAALNYFNVAAEQVNGVAHPFDPMGPEREGIINIAWRVSRGLLPTRRDIEQTAKHPSVVQFYNKCAQAFV